jgi:TPR repeat protein
MKRFLSVLTVLLSLASVPAIAQSANKAFNDGVAAFQSRDYATALKLWMPLAEKDDAEAQRNIGIMFQQGLGVPQSDAEAAKWYRRAAENGHARAQQNLGVMYEEGAGVLQDYVEAAKWYRKSAEAGNVVAKVNLGVMRENGFPGVPLNVVLAHMWFNLAAAQGSADAANFRDEIAADMSPEQVAEAQRLAKEWLDKHPQ